MKCCFIDFPQDKRSKMVVEWKERGHEVEYHEAAQEPNCIDALRACGLLNLFRIPGIRSQPKLLQYLISWWDVDRQLFMIRGQELEIDVTDIYFITGLFRKGQWV